MNQLQRDLLRRRITEKFTRNPARPGDRSAAVLLPIVDRIEPAVVGIWRAQHGIHGGQFCFPGGSVEAGDENAWETAIRETREEIGLEDPVESLSGLGEYNTHVSSFRVDVHVGFVDGNPRWRRQPSEVEAILEIPLSFLQGLHARLPKVEDVWDLPIDAGYDLDPSPFLIDGELPERGAGHRLEAAEGPRDMPFIWGLSARVLYDFLKPSLGTGPGRHEEFAPYPASLSSQRAAISLQRSHGYFAPHACHHAARNRPHFSG